MSKIKSLTATMMQYFNPYYFLTIAGSVVFVLLFVGIVDRLDLGTNETNVLVWVLLILVATGCGIVSQWYGRKEKDFDSDEWKSSFWQGVSTEMIGALVTGFMVFFIVGAGAETDRKAELIRKMGSQINDVALSAAEEMRVSGWLLDGSLRGADLHGASLPDANMRGVVLSDSQLYEANLQGADMYGANLSNAVMWGINLSDANLIVANMQNTDLISANMSGATLRGADLSGAGLFDSDLSNAELHDANFSGADLESANLSNANLFGANLNNANLPGANLSGADLTSADMLGAVLV
jgi:uncharacterized protein YjbI with pentapeptide repeats